MVGLQICCVHCCCNKSLLIFIKLYTNALRYSNQREFKQQRGAIIKDRGVYKVTTISLRWLPLSIFYSVSLSIVQEVMSNFYIIFATYSMAQTFWNTLRSRVTFSCLRFNILKEIYMIWRNIYYCIRSFKKDSHENHINSYSHMIIVVILVGNSEHVAHAWRK